MKKIVTKSIELGVNTYFFNYSSEINNLGGDINIFLNVNQSKEQIESDFFRLIGMINYIKYGNINDIAPINVCPLKRERGKVK